MKLLFYAINGLGMGHLNRSLVLADSIRAADPSVGIHLVVDSPHFSLVEQAGFSVTKLPDRRHPLGYHRGRERRYELLPELFEPLIESYRPDGLIVDFLCKKALFERVRSRGVQLAAVLRKQRKSSLRMLRMNPGAGLVDHWLIPHTEEEWGREELPGVLGERSHYLGPVSRGIDAESLEMVRKELRPKDGRPLLILTIGGGGAAESRRLLNGIEAALMRLDRKLRLVLVYGPNFQGEIPLDTILRNPSGVEVEVLRRRFIARLPEAMCAADLVVTHTGYNTSLELRRTGTPAVLVPLMSTGRDDQEARAEALASEGRGLVSPPEPEALASALAKALDEGIALRRAPDLTADPALQGRLLLDILEKGRRRG